MLRFEQSLESRGRKGEREREKGIMGERTAHRRLTRIYGFVGFANKESACETGFSGDTSRPRVESVVVGGEEESTKTPDPPTFRISWSPSAVNATTKFITTPVAQAMCAHGRANDRRGAEGEGERERERRRRGLVREIETSNGIARIVETGSPEKGSRIIETNLPNIRGSLRERQQLRAIFILHARLPSIISTLLSPFFAPLLSPPPPFESRERTNLARGDR